MVDPSLGHGSMVSGAGPLAGRFKLPCHRRIAGTDIPAAHRHIDDPRRQWLPLRGIVSDATNIQLVWDSGILTARKGIRRMQPKQASRERAKNLPPENPAENARSPALVACT